MNRQNLVSVDGSFGEGGGQILRTAISLSAVLGKPVEVYNIRAKRGNPGLRPQHVGAVKAVASLCNAYVENLRIGADKIRFYPSKVKPSSLRLDLGTAGSITLVLQAVIPSAVSSDGEVDLEIVGGTDVRWSPTANYFKYVTLKAFRNIGVDVDMRIFRRGYYPRGGGLIKVKVKPVSKLNPISILKAEKPNPSIISICSRLPKSVAERQLKSAIDHLSEKGVRCDTSAVKVEEAPSPGSSILIYSVDDQGPYIGADAIGERGKPAEHVGREAAQHFLKEYLSEAPVDMHTGDMLVSILCLAKDVSRYRVSRVTQHLLTNLYVASLFTGCRYQVERLVDESAIVSIESVNETSN